MLNSLKCSLALFKISQQANCHNRSDLLDEFLSPEDQLLPAGRKNYLVSKPPRAHATGHYHAELQSA